MPRVKLLLLLREPIEAAYSAYQFGLKMRTYTSEEFAFEKVIQAELNYLNQGGTLFEQKDGMPLINPQCSLLARHVYIELLKPWFEVFDQRQIKVILSEDLFSAPDKVYRDVQEFLGLPIHRLGSYKPFNMNSYLKLEAAKELHLQEFFAPFNERLSLFLGRDLGWRYDKNITRSTIRREPSDLLDRFSIQCMEPSPTSLPLRVQYRER